MKDQSNTAKKNSKWRDTSHATWMRSSLAKESDESIVEIAEFEDGFRAVRDAKAPDKGTLYFSPEEWKVFQQGVREGEFDAVDLAERDNKITWVPSPLNSDQ